MDKKVKTSVRNLVEFVMRSGDIDTTYISNKRALMGIKAHQKLQSDGGENYKKEYFGKDGYLYRRGKLVGRKSGRIKS